MPAQKPGPGGFPARFAVAAAVALFLPGQWPLTREHAGGCPGPPRPSPSGGLVLLVLPGASPGGDVEGAFPDSALKVSLCLG